MAIQRKERQKLTPRGRTLQVRILLKVNWVRTKQVQVTVHRRYSRLRSDRVMQIMAKMSQGMEACRTVVGTIYQGMQRTGWEAEMMSSIRTTVMQRNMTMTLICSTTSWRRKSKPSTSQCRSLSSQTRISMALNFKCMTSDGVLMATFIIKTT